MLSQKMRRGFLSFFKEKGHAIIPSSPVVPHDDPTLLFTNAGMNQFKDAFLGKSARDYVRAATAQKCIRVGGKHNDLDNVGHTSRHLTFFEMLGNFSFGDYFKKEAIAYAYELSTRVFGFDQNKIWVTIFRDDDEAYELWKVYMPQERIVRLGEKDNFWAMGDTGPCGPCSELLFDRGERYGSARSPAEDASGERYLEFWNLVFMQFNKDSSGKMTPLPKQSIDTGAGLERIVSLKMDVESVFATDIFQEIIAEVETLSKRKYSPENAAFHVIADHLRSLSFAIADGAQPSNVERGYVLRKLLRRAVRYGKGLGLQEPFLARVLPRLVAVMGEDYPELKSSQGRIAEILTLEEEAFLRTLKRGGNILQSVIEKAKLGPRKQISGEEAFKLKDTYGFPLEEILLIAKDTGLEVNLESYELLEERAKETSKKSQEVHAQVVEEGVYKKVFDTHGPCRFVGYSEQSAPAKIHAIVHGGALVESLRETEEGMILLDTTPFYAEKGGQVGDTGLLKGKQGLFQVVDTTMPFPGIIAHRGTITKGALHVGEEIVASIDTERRCKIERYHTATHLLHWALTRTLGDHIRQGGSLVEEMRLRFDFTHHKPLTPEEIRNIEHMVNEKIRTAREVTSYELSLDEAQKRSEIKQFFGDKYGSKVRVVDIDFSQELCGGTHTRHIGTIGLFRIVKESSIAAGVRRIEAVIGADAEALMYHNEDLIIKAAASLKTAPSQLLQRVSELLEEQKASAQEIKELKKLQLKQKAEELLRHCEKIGSLEALFAKVDEDLSSLCELLCQPGRILIIAKVEGESVQMMIRIGANLVQKGLHAGQLIKEIASHIQGSGGGKAESASAGGKNPSGIAAAFSAAHKLLEKWK